MLSFAQPWWLLLLLVPPALIFWHAARGRHHEAVVRFSSLNLIDPAHRRILDRIKRSAPAGPNSARLFGRRIAERIIADPYATKRDADAARKLLAMIRDEPAAFAKIVGAESQGSLFGEGA